MKSIKSHLLFTIFIFSSYAPFAQGVSDAVRWSFTNPGGTARTLGVGGAFGAMGGDFSVININPAGLGTYKKSEFTFSPSLSLGNTTSYLVANPNSAQKESYSKFSIDNVSVVFASRGGSNWAIGFSKISDLSKDFNFAGRSNISITRRFAERANGKNIDQLDDFEAYPAYYIGAIFDADSNQVYDTDITELDEIYKTQTIEQSGYLNEFSVGWGKSFDNKFQIGGSIGIPFASYEESKYYSESDPNNKIPIFNRLNYTEYLNTTGAGINFKAGFILTPSKYFRVGGAVHSPSWFTLTDNYYTNMDYSYNDGTENFYEFRSPDGSFKYKLKTPAKFVGSVGSILDFGKVKAFINGDVEWIDYNNNTFNFGAYSSDPSEVEYSNQINNEIEKYLGSVLNVRLGTEIAYGIIRLRAGYETGDSPLSNDKINISTLSFGFGVRYDNFFLDFGLRNRQYTEGYVPFQLVDESKETLVNNDINHTRAVMTVGFKF